MGRCYCQDDTFICVQKIDGVFYKLFVFLFWLTELCVQGALKSHGLRVCAGKCVLCMAAACGLCVYSLEWVCVVSLGSSDTPPVCWCLSASCWNLTRFSVQPVWTDEITRRKHTALSPPHAVVCALRSWSDLVRVKNDDSLKSLFVFYQNHICHCFSRIF